MRYLKFELSILDTGSWNGSWSGENKNNQVVKTFQPNDFEKVNNILSIGFFDHLRNDGWKTRITVKEVEQKEAKKIRIETDGFAGCNWMIDSIIEKGEIAENYSIKSL